ncbi:hypothetical protein L6452_29820 [Arctium lappa]|uniref:Uncharacterized protein n=1 Tax=Arctium lappa TaxID=4217 RepID=A0ACB8ZHV1_ARCLA|nr:hypothetical protein L6452_29820 [Arctium lappa]
MSIDGGDGRTMVVDHGMRWEGKDGQVEDEMFPGANEDEDVTITPSLTTHHWPPHTSISIGLLYCHRPPSLGTHHLRRPLLLQPTSPRPQTPSPLSLPHLLASPFNPTSISFRFENKNVMYKYET